MLLRQPRLRRGALHADGLLADLVERHGRRAAKRLGVTGAASRHRAEYALLCRAAAAGDPVALDVVERGVHLLAQAAVSLVNVVDVQLLVLGGSALQHISGFLLPAVADAVNGRTIARWVRTVAVERSVLGDDVGAVGAASLVLHGTYAPGCSALRDRPLTGPAARFPAPAAQPGIVVGCKQRSRQPRTSSRACPSR